VKSSTSLRYLLDTNTCIRYLNGPAPKIRERLRIVPRAQVAVCAVVKAEMFAGARRSTDPGRTLERQQDFLIRFVSLPFDDAAAEACGRIQSRLLMMGTPIGPNDLLIAAIAVANGLILVTHNTGEFSRVPDLSLEDWEA
jgi:tRNA(fMet)-specific endonuclease VapC